MRHGSALLGLTAVAAGAICGETPARADCTPPTAQSTCLDADALWLPAAPTRFLALPSGHTPVPTTFVAGIAFGFLSRPIVFRTDSPDPNGREVRVVNDVVDATASAAFVPARHLELTAAVPFAIARMGTGLSFVTSQGGPELTSAALRDVRLGGGYELFSTSVAPGNATYALMARLDLALPTGDHESFAGERGPAFAPTISSDLTCGRFFAGAVIGARLRQPVALGGVRYGTELISMLGAGANLVDGRLLSIAAEMWLMPNLAGQGQRLPDGSHFDASLVPAEWMLSLETHPGDFEIGLGGGTALPLSTETRSAPGTTSTRAVAAVTSPAYRAVVTARYVWGKAP